MLDIKRIRKDLDAVIAGLAKRSFIFDSETFLALDSRRKELDISSQNLLSERKQAAKQVGLLIQQGMAVDEAKKTVDKTLARLEQDLESVQQACNDNQQELDSFLLTIPNVPLSEVPVGLSEADNHEVLTWGTPKQFEFQARDHVDIGSRNGLLDFESGIAITGARFTVLRGEIATLHRALAQFMLDLHTIEHGYTEVNVPFIVNRTSLIGTGQLPKFEEDLFKLDGDQEFYLIPTAEVPVTNIMRDTIAESLPIKFACHSPCFRSEAGSYGRDTRGMIRQHQFEKVELVQFVPPASSNAALEELTGHAETVLQKLELPYRKVILCGGDIGFASQKTYDLEVWLPGQAAYREISSCSNFGDFQARRLQARWRNPATGKPEYLHTLNGSGLAVGRTLVAVLENYQCADGSVTVPEVLRTYTGGKTRLGGQ